MPVSASILTPPSKGPRSFERTISANVRVALDCACRVKAGLHEGALLKIQQVSPKDAFFCESEKNVLDNSYPPVSISDLGKHKTMPGERIREAALGMLGLAVRSPPHLKK